MDIEKLREELIADEGMRLDVYRCTENHLTVGVGHRIIEGDAEYGKPEGYTITERRMKQLFDLDIAIVREDCHRLYEDFSDLPEEAQRIIANMMFNMGLPTMKKFKGMKRCVDERQWAGAALEMLDSKWARQLPNRSERLVKRMRALANE
jgi:lysozyme